MYLHAYGESVIEISTNTIPFVTEFLPLGVTNLRPAFTVEIKGVLPMCEPASHASHASQGASHASHGCEPCEPRSEPCESWLRAMTASHTVIES